MSWGEILKDLKGICWGNNMADFKSAGTKVEIANLDQLI